MSCIECSVCWSSFGQDDEIISTLCGHVYHSKCLTKWLSRTRACPKCRKTCESHKCLRIYLDFGQSCKEQLNNELSVSENLKKQITELQNDEHELFEQFECQLTVIESLQTQLSSYLNLKNQLSELQETKHQLHSRCINQQNVIEKLTNQLKELNDSHEALNEQFRVLQITFDFSTLQVNTIEETLKELNAVKRAFVQQTQHCKNVEEELSELRCFSDEKIRKWMQEKQNFQKVEDELRCLNEQEKQKWVSTVNELKSELVDLKKEHEMDMQNKMEETYKLYSVKFNAMTLLMHQNGIRI